MVAAIAGVADLTALGQNKCLYLQPGMSSVCVCVCAYTCTIGGPVQGVHMQGFAYCN